MSSTHKSSLTPHHLNPWLARVAVAGCFLGHGTLALQNSNNYVSAWSQWVQSLFPLEQKYELSQMMLNAVGAIDIWVALACFLPEIPLPALIWAVGWGSATAMSRLYFLGSFTPEYFANIWRPIAEFISRVPNWMVPMLLFAYIRPGDRFSGIIRKVNLSTALTVAAAAQALAILIHYIIDLNISGLERELIKKLKPLWYFHLIGISAAVTCAAMLAARLTRSHAGINRVFKALIMIALPLSYGLMEGFEVFVSNMPHGLMFTVIRVAEHIPIYLCLGYYLASQAHQWKRAAGS